MQRFAVLGTLFACSLPDFEITDQMLPQCDYERKNDDSIPVNYSELSTISTLRGSSVPTLVYSRKKRLGGTVATFSAQAPENVKKNIDCLSAISSEAPLFEAQGHVNSQTEPETEATENPLIPPLARKPEPHLLRLEDSEPTHGYSVGRKHSCDEAPKTDIQKIIEVDCVKGSCSSSKSNIQLVSASTDTGADDMDESPSSSLIALECNKLDPSRKELYISLLRTQGLLEEAFATWTRTSPEEAGITSDIGCMRSCKICVRSESSMNMLICDNCEEAFHVSCCNPRVKKIPTDDWFCHSCLKKKRKLLSKKFSKKLSGNTKEIGRSKVESNPITLMLEDTEPYVTGVRIGKAFQAEVPEWSGPIDSGVGMIGESLDLDTAAWIDLPQSSSRSSKISSIGNWLQCREVIDTVSRTICGKWRRAPIFEVQTDNWECFCSIFWDPIRSDCAVPQELETDEVLKQLKYIEKLRPQLIAKRRKVDIPKFNGNQRVNRKSVQNL